MHKHTSDTPFHERHDEELLTLEEVAEIRKASEHTLRWWRQQGKGPEFFTMSKRLYTTLGDVRAFIRRQRLFGVAVGTTEGRLALPGCGSPGGDVMGGQVGSGGLWDRGDVREDRGDRDSPGPRFGDPETPSASAVGQPGRHVEEPVAQRLRLATGEHPRVAGAAEQAGPGGQVGGDLDDREQVWLMSNSRDGKRPRPESLARRMRSSTRAWARCRTLRNASCPVVVLVTKAR